MPVYDAGFSYAVRHLTLLSHYNRKQARYAPAFCILSVARLQASRLFESRDSFLLHDDLDGEGLRALFVIALRGGRGRDLDAVGSLRGSLFHRELAGLGIHGDVLVAGIFLVGQGSLAVDGDPRMPQ